MHRAHFSVALLVGGWLVLGLVNGCEAERNVNPRGAPSQPKGGGPAEQSSPPQLPDPPDPALTGGQTGSGNPPPAPFMCDALAPDACGASLALAFAHGDIPLLSTSSECVRASTLDPALDDVPVCRCKYERDVQFSNNSGLNEVAYDIGLTRRRAQLGESNDGCEVWWQGRPESSVCLLESVAFPGCSLEAAASSCQRTCDRFRENHRRIVLQRPIEVLASSCVQCNSGRCVGVLRTDERCFFVLQSSLGLGYMASPIPCDGEPEELLLSQINASEYVRDCTLEDGGLACDHVPGEGCADARVPGPEDAGLAQPDASSD